MQRSPRNEDKTKVDKPAIVERPDRDKTDPPGPPSIEVGGESESLEDLGDKLFDELEHTNPWLVQPATPEVAAILEDMPAPKSAKAEGKKKKD